MHVGHCKCTVPITCINYSIPIRPKFEVARSLTLHSLAQLPRLILNEIKLQQIGFKSFFFMLPQQYFAPTMCIYKQGNFIYHIQLI